LNFHYNGLGGIGEHHYNGLDYGENEKVFVILSTFFVPVGPLKNGLLSIPEQFYDSSGYLNTSLHSMSDDI